MRLFIRDLSPSTTYRIQVRAVGTTTVSEWSRAFDILTQADTTVPTTPTGFAWAVSGPSFYATWNKVTTNLDGTTINDFDHYELSLTAGAVTKVIVTKNETYTLTFAENAALFGTAQPSITAKVRAVDNSQNPGPYTTTITSANAVPGNPTGLTATGDLNAIQLSWTPPGDTDIVGYNVYSGASKVAFTAGTTYRYASTTYSSQVMTVRTVDQFGQESTGASATATPASPFGGDTTPPSTPTGLTAVITTTNTADLRTTALVSWTAVADTDLSEYRVQYRAAGTTDWSTIFVPKDATSTLVTGLRPYVNYEFRILAADFAANQSAYTAVVTALGATNNAPSVPQAPGAASNTMQVQVTPTGLNATGTAMESDVAFYEVYASTTTGFTPAAANQLGTIPVGPAMAATFPLPATGGTANQTWFIKVIAVDNQGLKSTASAQASASPTLITATNIVDATITSAKITSLNADKLTAGSGIITDMAVNSKLTMGNGTLNGSIESFGYTAGGTTGFHIGSDGLTIKSGVISAPALLIQSGMNLIPPQYADLEWASDYYTGGGVFPSTATIAMTTTTPKYGNQCMTITRTGTTGNAVLYFSTGGSASTDYNIEVVPGQVVTASAWVRNRSAVSTACSVGIRWNNNTNASLPATATVTPTASSATWVRVYNTQTVPAGITAMKVYMVSATVTAGAQWDVDGVQAEIQNGAMTTPSTWSPSSMTKISGYGITTGAIQSTAVAQVYDSVQNLYVNDPTNQPAWSINLSGSATLSNLAVRGVTILGTVNDDPAALSTIASANYIPGDQGQGWMIRSDGYAEFRDMAANSISGDVIDGGIITGAMIIGTTVSSRAYDTITQQLTGAGTDLDPTGLNSYDTDGAIRFTLPNDPTLPPTFRGDAEMDHLSVSNLSMNALASVEQGATMTMQSSVASPGNPPTPTISWVTTTFTKAASSGEWTDRHGFTGDAAGNWYMFNAYNNRVEKYNASGVRTATSASFGANGTIDAGSVVYIAPNGIDDTGGTAGRLWVLWHTVGAGSTSGYQVTYVNPATMALGSTFVASMPGNTGRPAIGQDYTSGEFLIGHSRSSDNVIMYRRGNYTAATNSIGWSAATVGPIYGVVTLSTVGYGPFDFGVNRYWYKNIGTYDTVWPVAAGNGSTAEDVPNFWDTGLKATIVGLHYNGTNFFAFTTDGKMTKYETGNKWAGPLVYQAADPNAKWYASYSWTDGTAETMLGPVASFTMKKRARVTIKTNAVTAPATAARVYLSRGNTAPNTSLSSMYLQGTTTGTTAPSLLVTNSTFAGTFNQTVPTFGGGVPAVLRSAAADASGAIISLSGDGSSRIGPFKFTTTGADANDTGWITVTPAVGWATGGYVAYRVHFGQFVEVKFVDAIKSTNVAVTGSGGITDEIWTGVIPAQYRHIGGSMYFPIAWGGMAATANVNLSGDIRIILAEATGVARTITAGSTVNGRSPLYIAGS